MLSHFNFDDNGGLTLYVQNESPATDKEALKAERRRSNNLEKELRGVRQQLTRFSEINPE